MVEQFPKQVPQTQGNGPTKEGEGVFLGPMPQLLLSRGSLTQSTLLTTAVVTSPPLVGEWRRPSTTTAALPLLPSTPLHPYLLGLNL